MSDWKPKLRTGLRWESLNLSAEEGFLLSRIDGSTDVDGLTHLTGLSSAQITQALTKLQLSGAIDPPPVRSEPPQRLTAATSTAARVRPPPRVDATAEQPPLLSADDSAEDDAAALRGLSDDAGDLPSLEGDDTDEGAAVDDDAAGTGAEGFDDGPTDPGQVPRDMASEPADELPPTDGDKPEEPSAPAENGEKADDGEGDSAGVDEDETGEKRDEEAAAVEEGNHRKLFEMTLHDLPQEEREKLARAESGNVLCALCFDPVAAVINGIMENPNVGFPHARLIARYHRTPQGIDAVFKRSELVRDGQVQRYLLANPMLQDPHFKKIMQPKRLAIVYKWALSRDIPEKNRNKVRQLLRSKWSTAEGDERCNLVVNTEGRCLLMLAGLPFDSQTTSLLCQRTYHSSMLIQNLARFSATPPLLITHLLKQAVVKRQVHLRTMLTQHSNCPSNEKRKTH
ncbi:MAG: hypothetical protein Q8O67_00450 [Deltaproteobacteria bacterium]|nr:hypothetical protein [Deltaproteobacteria bacterium]